MTARARFWEATHTVRPTFSGPAFLGRHVVVHAMLAAVVFNPWEGPGWTIFVGGLLCIVAVFLPLPGSRLRGGVPVQVRTREGSFPAPSGRMHVRADQLWLEARVFVGWPVLTAWFLVPTLAMAAFIAVYFVVKDVSAVIPVSLVALELGLSFLMLQSSCGAHRLVVPIASIERARRDGKYLKLLVRLVSGRGLPLQEELYIESSVARVVFLLEHLDAAGVEVEPGKPFGT